MIGKYGFPDYIEDRAIGSGLFIHETGATIREAAEKAGVSKSTTHKDVTERMEIIDPSFAAEIRVILDEHIEERSVRGGMATKMKFSNGRK